MGDEGEAVAGEAAARGDREPRGHALGTALPTLPRALHLDPAEVRRADLLHGEGRALPDAVEPAEHALLLAGRELLTGEEPAAPRRNEEEELPTVGSELAREPMDARQERGVCAHDPRVGPEGAAGSGGG